jgi:hypothetical protein
MPVGDAEHAEMGTAGVAGALHEMKAHGAGRFVEAGDGKSLGSGGEAAEVD